MELQEIIDYCASKPGASQDFPFDEKTLVVRAGKKMFALISLEPPHRVNLKCEPLLAQELRKKYSAVSGAYHMNKKHWNSVLADSKIPASELKEWIDMSYDLVVKSMSRAEREALKETIDKT